ncbi:hypothetical protein BDQ17DRAFT_1330731 [Cyathus striatus]|nr:hypothetical protein BDQ17DRAFT_1330731 [Cyathus striatus]
MDNFVRTAGPDKHKRAMNIVNDPYAAAKFFHYLINIILSKLFGITVTQFKTHVTNNNNVEIAYSCPPNPDSEDFWEELRTFEGKVAHAKQINTCEVRRCIIYDKNGHPKCKRRAPFERSETEYIKEDGTWAPKRLYKNTNNWNPSTTTQVKGNNDKIKLFNARNMSTEHKNDPSSRENKNNDNEAERPEDEDDESDDEDSNHTEDESEDENEKEITQADELLTLQTNDTGN